MRPHRRDYHLGRRRDIKAKLPKKALKMKGCLETLASVVDKAARAYHAERLASRILKQTVRPRVQSFLRAYAPEITKEAGRIVDEAVISAERKLHPRLVRGRSEAGTRSSCARLRIWWP